MRWALALACAVAGLPAVAHEAPSGWSYEAWCCSNEDCQPVPSDMVRATADGWLIDLAPGVHKMAPGGFRGLVPYDGSGIRRSPDGLFHACILPVRPGVRAAPELRCLYVPDMGA